VGWDKSHKQKTREKILRHAGQLFTRKGFDKVGIDDVMQAAGLTRGAFYAHFGSKSELYAEAIVTAAKAARQNVLEPLPANPGIREVAERYLSSEHRQGLDDSCPLAFLTTDIQQRDDQVRGAYTRVFKSFAQAIEPTGSDDLSPEALQTAVLMIGGVAIARALNNDRLAEQLLEACLDGVVARYQECSNYRTKEG
jgi:TetR/AcrR family transcriptional repressor of nem operon